MRLVDHFPRWRYLLLAAALGSATVLVPVLAHSETGPTVEAVNEGGTGVYETERHRWSPTAVAVIAGGVVTFQSTGMTVPHGVVWDGGPATPSCTGVPIDSGEVNWKGTCTFAQAGTYTFHCYVHPTEMTGRVDVSAAGTTVTTTPPTTTTTTTTGPTVPPPTSESSPLAGSLAQAFRLARSQRGPSIRGTVAISQSGAGGRLEVELLAKRAVLARAAGSPVLVGRFVRTAVPAGKVSFSVSLDRRARHALAHRRRLALVVKLLVRPLHGRAVTSSRAIVDRV